MQRALDVPNQWYTDMYDTKCLINRFSNYLRNISPFYQCQ